MHCNISVLLPANGPTMNHIYKDEFSRNDGFCGDNDIDCRRCQLYKRYALFHYFAVFRPVFGPIRDLLSENGAPFGADENGSQGAARLKDEGSIAVYSSGKFD